MKFRENSELCLLKHFRLRIDTGGKIPEFEWQIVFSSQ